MYPILLGSVSGQSTQMMVKVDRRTLKLFINRAYIPYWPEYKMNTPFKDLVLGGKKPSSYIRVDTVNDII